MTYEQQHGFHPPEAGVLMPEITEMHIGEGRKKLLALQKKGDVVFHGSPARITQLEPRQAHNSGEEDGEPAIFATQYADAAIFRALINGNEMNEDHDSGFGMEGDDLYLSATQNLLDNAAEKRAFVYVLKRSQFGDFEGTQCRSTEHLKPLDVVEVTAEDLPEYINVISLN